jgi:hypothetical protein
VRENAIFGDAVQDAVRAYDCGIHCSGEHQDADENDKRLKYKFQVVWADKIQRQAVNEIPEKMKRRP